MKIKIEVEVDTDSSTDKEIIKKLLKLIEELKHLQ